jgi:hypothetical protein
MGALAVGWALMRAGNKHSVNTAHAVQQRNHEQRVRLASREFAAGWIIGAIDTRWNNSNHADPICQRNFKK